MNFLFGIATGLASAAAFWLAVWLIPERMWALAPAEVLEWRKTAARFLMLVIVLAVTWSNAVTYGPRVELARTIIPVPAETAKAVEPTDIFKQKDRIGQFDDRLENELD